MRQIILYTFLFFIATVTSAQQVGKFRISEYTTENGLPSNGIKGLQWDETTGFLWLATEAGIVRFNGIDFKTYSKENTSFITAERMQFLVRNNRGAIYAADQMAGTFIVSQNNLQFYKKIKTLDNSYGKSLYALSVSDSFFNYKQLHPGVKSYALNFDKIIPITDTSMLVINNSIVFLQTLHGTAPEKLNFIKSKIASGFKIDGRIYLLTDNNKVLHADIGTQKLAVVPLTYSSEPGSSSNFNYGTIFSENGMTNPIMISGKFAWKLGLVDNKIVADEICNIMPENVLIQFVQYSSQHKMLFVGTNSKGLMIIRQNQIDVMKNKLSAGSERNAYYSQIELAGGNILTNEGNVIGLNSNANTTLPVNGKFGFNVNITADSILWYSKLNVELKSSCLYSYNYKTGISKIYKHIKAGSIVVLQSSDNKHILVSETGIGELINDSLHYRTKFTGFKINSTPADMIETAPGEFIIAMHTGLLKYNLSSNKIDTIVFAEEFNARTLFRHKDYLFIGTYGKGFFVWKNGKLKAMPVDKSKYLLYTHCFIPDTKGYCWISTNRGLFIARLDEMAGYFDGKQPQIYYHYYGRNNGMEITEMNGGCLPCALTLKNGTISFPTMDGLLWVQPEKAYPVLPNQEIYLDNFTADNRNIEINSPPNTRLSHKTEEIVVHLGIPAWNNEENIYLEYQLNDTVSWRKINTSTNASIRLNKLPPGNYVLRIRKLNGFGFNNYSYKTIEFTIATPWYRQWWFFLLIISGVLGALYIFLRIRTSQLLKNQERLEKQIAEKTTELQHKNEVLEKNNTINTRLISIISHDIITPLKFLHVAGKNLLEKKALMNEELKDETIKEITTTSKELQLLSTNILNWIKYQNENRRLVKEQFYLYEMLNQVLSVLNSMAHQKNLKLINQVDPQLQVTQFFEPLKIMIYNLFTNAIHFSENGDIAVDAREADNKIIISVKDEGVGMTAEQIKNIMADQFIISSANIDNKKGNGLGYLIIKDLLKMMNAKLSITSEKAKGTTVYIELPK